jgi:hypothetical protein
MNRQDRHAKPPPLVTMPFAPHRDKPKPHDPKHVKPIPAKPDLPK